MQGTQVRCLVGISHLLRGNQALWPQLVSPCAGSPCSAAREAPQWEARALQWCVAAACCRERKPSRSSKDPAQPKVNKQIMFLMYGNTEDPQIPKAILRKKNGAGGIMLPDYWYKGVIRTLQNWHKNRNTDQWNSIECWETNSQMYGQVICDKRGKNMQWRRDSLFNRQYREKWTATC